MGLLRDQGRRQLRRSVRAERWPAQLPSARPWAQSIVDERGINVRAITAAMSSAAVPTARIRVQPNPNTSGDSPPGDGDACPDVAGSMTKLSSTEPREAWGSVVNRASL